MNEIRTIMKEIPEMLSGKELLDAMSSLPEYREELLQEHAAMRLMALSDLYQVYIPSQMSLEIYSKLYLALLRSLQKKGTKLAVQQQRQNYQAIRQQEYSGIMGGSDSFSIIGTSGIGKSSAVSRAISLITENRLIEVSEPYAKIIPCVTVQCPFDSSVKGLLLEILRKVDEYIGRAEDLEKDDKVSYLDYCIRGFLTLNKETDSCNEENPAEKKRTVRKKKSKENPAGNQMEGQFSLFDNIVDQ